MTLDEYRHAGMALYSDLAKAVQTILGAALKANGSIHVQLIQTRAKEPAKVIEKLPAGRVTDIETLVKDLAGVRVIVYTNSDVARLNNSSILWQNFDIVLERTKFHYPRHDEANQSQFIGRNYVVRLKESRVALPEYQRFIGLQCEVQIQTILDHAWSETAHDTIYKSPKLDGVGAAQMAKIKERMRDIQQKYLLRAGYEFQQVLNDFEHIVSGQRLVESDILASIRDAVDNNIRVTLLQQYATNVLPIIDDKASAAPEIRALLIEAARRAEAVGITPLESPIGPMSGRTHEDVLEKIIGILEDIRYIEPADAYATYCDLFLVFEDPKLRLMVVTAVGELAAHASHVWRRFGPEVQEVLLDAIAATPQDHLASTRPLMIEVARKCLEPDVTGTSSTSKTFTWESCPVSVCDSIYSVRDQAIAMLGHLFTSSQSEEERRKIYLAMQTATRLPTHGRCPASLHERVLTDTCTVITLLSEQADDLESLLKEKIEHDTLFHYWRAKAVPADSLQDEGARAACEAVIAAAEALRKRFNADADFLIFKTLIGFESVFDYEWDGQEQKSDMKAKNAFRNERATEYLAEVTEETADAWFHRLNRYASIKSNDLAMFPQLGSFISEVAQQSSKIAVSWLDRSRGQPLAQFTPDMLLGLYDADQDAALKWISAEINRKGNLRGIAHFVRQAKPALPELLGTIANEGIAASDIGAVYKVLEACVDRASDFGMPLARRLAVKSVVFLNDRRHYSWTEPFWIWGKKSGILMQFNDTERATLFAAIRDLPKIDFRVEELLVPYGETHASDIIDLFGARLEHDRKTRETRSADDGFEAVPFDFSHLHHSMQHSGGALLPKALEWYRADPIFGRYKSAGVIAIFFPDLPEDVTKGLIEYARSGDSTAQNFVIEVMANYRGDDVAFRVLKELVAVLPVDDQMLPRVRAALGATGILHGAFGHRDAIIAERERLAIWLADERGPVRLFAEAHIRTLENEITAAQQAAESDRAMLKLKFGEGLDDVAP